MKRYTFIILAAVLSMLGIQTASAQQTQDALYIYRNDGGFNGFFFSDIERIEYSKVDTLGVEQDDYVVQEVYALDTLYRIPLNAIDSVTFVTPETIYKKDVVHTTESDLWNYVIGSDSVTMLILASNTPAAMIPKAGDKIVTTKSRNFLPGGFYGQVQSVQNGADGITVNCVVPALTELFDQFVCKAAAASVDPETQARRRLFGNENSTEFTLPVYDNYLKIDLTNISYGINDNWSLAGSGVLDTGVRDVMTVRIFLAVRAILGINFDYVARMEKRSWFNLDLKGAVSGQFDLPLGKTYTWITDTPFAIETEAGVSVSGTGEVELKIKREHVTSDYAMVQYNDCFYDEKRESAIASTHLVNEVDETSLTGKFTVTAGPYFWSCVSLMKKEIGAVGTRYDAGIKAEVSAELKLTDYLMAAVPQVIPVYMLANPTALYDMINRDGSIKVGPFCTGKIEASIGKWKKEFEMFDVNQMYGFEGGLVPKFSGTSLSYDEEKMVLNANTNLGRKTLIGNRVGFAAYYTKSGKQAVRQLNEKEYVYNFKKEPNFKEMNLTLKGVGGGQEVTVYPITNIGHFNYEMLAAPYVTYTIPALMKVEPEEMEFEATGGTDKFVVTDNLDKKEAAYHLRAEVDFGGDKVKPWFSAKWDEDNYVLTVNRSDSVDARSATITFIQSNDDESIRLEQTVTVKQAAMEVDPPSVEPPYLEFPTEGGASAVKLTFGGYSLRGAAALSASAKKWLKRGWNVDYVEPKRRMNHYFITAAPNDTEAARTDTVRLFFTNDPEAPEESRYYIPVIVKQAAGPYNLQNVRKLFVGTWIGISYDSNNKPSWERRVIFYDDGTFNSQDRFVNSKTGEWGAWSKLEKQTYSVQSVETSAQYYKVYISLTGYSAGQFVEIYPHFMRHGGFYYEREDGTGDLWWKGRTRASVSIDMNEKSLVPLKDVSDVSLGFSDETE